TEEFANRVVRGHAPQGLFDAVDGLRMDVRRFTTLCRKRVQDHVFGIIVEHKNPAELRLGCAGQRKTILNFVGEGSLMSENGLFVLFGNFDEAIEGAADAFTTVVVTESLLKVV